MAVENAIRVAAGVVNYINPDRCWLLIMKEKSRKN